MKNNIYIMLAIFGLLIITLVVFCVWPLLQDIKNNSEKLISIKNDAAGFALQNNKIEDFKKKYQDYQPNLERINQLFADSKNPVGFIEFLENTAVSSGVSAQISSLSIGSQKWPTIGVSVSLSDNYLKILNFLEKIENGPYLLEVQNASIARSSQDADPKKGSSGKVDIGFSVQTYAK